MPRAFARLAIIASTFCFATAPSSFAFGQNQAKSADQHYLDGAAAEESGDYATAVTEYEAAYQLTKEPTLLYRIATAHERAGDNEAALVYYRRYLEVAKTADDRDRVRARIQELEGDDRGDDRLDNGHGSEMGKEVLGFRPALHLWFEVGWSNSESTTSEGDVAAGLGAAVVIRWRRYLGAVEAGVGWSSAGWTNKWIAGGPGVAWRHSQGSLEVRGQLGLRVVDVLDWPLEVGSHGSATIPFVGVALDLHVGMLVTGLIVRADLVREDVLVYRGELIGSGTTELYEVGGVISMWRMGVELD